jgi:hypothetical protein
MGCYASSLREPTYSDLLTVEDHSSKFSKKYKVKLIPLIMGAPLKSGSAKLST